MSAVAFSAALPESIAEEACARLLRDDGQEDLCFALWFPSQGRSRYSALIQKIVAPMPGDRNIHGNASFEPAYFQRALVEASAAGAGLALLHSHPGGRAWQDMSHDDITAERSHAGAALGATNLPLLGLTLAGQDQAWSARFWRKAAPRRYERFDCGTVRIVGDALRVTFMDRLAPPPRPTNSQKRTIATWGEHRHKDLSRLHIGVVGAGSVGGFVAESAARTGFENVSLIDFDFIEEHNLDRLVYATRADIGASKVATLASRLRKTATAAPFRVQDVDASVYENDGFRAALDCDVLIACVDRPWARQALNLIAYAHLIPVVDGGIAVRRNKQNELAKADWRAHTATPGRICLECLGQYRSAEAQMEREGLLDDPTYIEGLRQDHHLLASENVFAFSMACASLQTMQMLALTLSPLGQSNPGSQLYHFVGGFMESAEIERCHHACLFPTLIARGDSCGFDVTGTHRGKLQHVPLATEKSLKSWLRRLFDRR